MVTESITTEQRGIWGVCVVNPELQRLLSLINQHYRTNHTVAFYADQLGMKPVPLLRLCRSELGVGAKSIISGKLMERAKELLPVRTAEQTAAELGFRDVTALSRFFKRNAGCTATYFRKTHHC
jgi:AraC-like DNA-binding protein